MINYELKMKTRLKTVDECIAYITNPDVGGEHVLVGGKKTHGRVDKNGHVTISSYTQFGRMYRFEGEIISREDGIYLEGEVTMKTTSQIVLSATFALMAYFGVIYLQGGLFAESGLFFGGIVVGIIYLFTKRPLERDMKRTFGE